MRKLHVTVSTSDVEKVREAAERHGGPNAWQVPAKGDGTDVLLIVHLPNREVGAFIEDVSEIAPYASLSLIPRGVLVLEPPPEEAPEQVADVSSRSPIEIILGGIQSTGSWTGLLGYSAAGAVVAWIGLYTNTEFLLIAAMLIVPFAGPAMNAAIATAAGKTGLLKQSVLRYGAGLGVAIVVSLLLTLIFGPLRITGLMVEIGSLSAVLVLLPITAGAAGALNLVQSERDSLVSSAAVGMLVAASTAPPAALIGMAAVHGDLELVKSAVFVLVVQLVGIHLSGTIVFRLFGVSANGVRFMGGSPSLMPWALGVSTLLLAALLIVQFATSPELQRNTQAQRAASSVNEYLKDSELVYPVEIEARFTRADAPGPNKLLVVVYAERRSDVQQSDDEIQDQLERSIQRHLDAKMEATPLVSVTVLAPPGEAGPGAAHEPGATNRSGR